MDVDKTNYYREDGQADKVNTYFADDFKPAVNRAERRRLERVARKLERVARKLEEKAAKKISALEVNLNNVLSKEQHESIRKFVYENGPNPL